MEEDCIFCKIVKGEIPSHKIWEDENHLAILSIFPNTKGFTVVMPKKHHPSYGFDVAEDILLDLISASKKVAKILDSKFEDVGRTGLMMEGFGIDHLHVKLFPMHGTKMTGWKPIASTIDKYFDKYEGYISSHDSNQADDKELAELADWKKRFDILKSNPPIQKLTFENKQGRKCETYFQQIGLENSANIGNLLKITSNSSCIPECLRLADLIGQSFKDFQF